MKNFEKMSACQMSSIRGGERIVTKIDVDGDGKWDMKWVTNTRTGKTKLKVKF